MKCIDPLLLAPTTIFLASKVEEFGLQLNNKLIGACQTLCKFVELFISILVANIGFSENKMQLCI
jgi:hypothetical protein